MNTETTTFDPIDLIIALESGELPSIRDVIEAYVNLKNSGIIYGLQGYYLREYQRLIDGGFVHRELQEDGTLLDVPTYDRIEEYLENEN
jgi:hypothetical protein